ncbi:hypothetical protein KRX57_01585 [Weeksellaceae bacterium TAE3-ERU29]|nr:hypothetical protein [Weeksellaceae bacterium TAE3-ERU29]
MYCSVLKTTLLTYDNSGNLIARQTSQIRAEIPSSAIRYVYDYNRLQEIRYPKHPENNVRYHYGKQEDTPSRRGRLWLVEDGSGGTEYFYGNMGEITKEIRSIRIKPTETQTYITEYAYDTWNRIQKMVYPDGETLDYAYNRAGNLTRLTGKKGDYTYDYIKQQGYDEFEQKVYRRYGNDTETHYRYDPVMRRLSGLQTTNSIRTIQNNQYKYDLVGNILNVTSQIPIINNALGGSSAYAYEYDDLNRLVKARGEYTGDLNKATYELTMRYNNLNGIVQKQLSHVVNEQQKGYTLDYEYKNQQHPHAPSTIADSNTPKPRTYTYDGNGNPTSYEEFKSFRVMRWDEENRLQGINDNGKISLYTYDHTGERAVKSIGESQTVMINGASSAVINHTDSYTAYINPYFVVNKGKFTKHYFEGASRIVSKLGEGTFQQPTQLTAGGIDYIKQSAKMQAVLDNYIRGLNVPPGPPTQQGIYATPEYTKQPYPQIDWEEINQNQEPPEGWPRAPKFNEPGDVPGPPVQFGPPIKPETVEGGYGFKDNGIKENNIYFYHPDHLGSSSYLTDINGRITQHTEYIAFGEVLFDEHNTSTKMPYLFNGKELDSETGLYYYGARYYDAKTSIWLNVDPLAEKYAPYNPYSFVANNPIENKEVDGRWWFSKNKKNNILHYGANTVRISGASQYAFKMSNVRTVHKKQTGWASYIPVIGNWINGSAMIQKIEDPSMSLDKGDIASLFLAAYFKGTRKLVKAAGAYQGGAKIALKLSEEFTTLTQSIASSPELKESWVELAVMEHFARVTSDGGNAIGTLSNTKDTDYTTIFRFSEDFVGELQGMYGNEYDSLKPSGMSRESYIENKVQDHMQKMFENKKTEIMKQFDE